MKISTEIKAIQTSIKSFAANANYAGSNLLQSDSTAAAGTGDLKVVASYNRTGASVTIDTVTVAAADTRVIDTSATGGTGMVDALLKDDFFAPKAGTAGDPNAQPPVPATPATPVGADGIKTALEAVETALGK